MEGSVSEEIVWQNEVGGVRAGEKRDVNTLLCRRAIELWK